MRRLGRKKLYLGGSVTLLILVGLLVFLPGDEDAAPPQSLKSRADDVGQAFVNRDRAAIDRVVDILSRRDADSWYEEVQSQLPEVLRNPQLRIDYTSEIKFKQTDKGKACVVTNISPGNLELARNLSKNASNLEWELLLYWKLDKTDGWVLDGEECLKAHRMDRGTKWSGRAADKKTFQQANK